MTPRKKRNKRKVRNRFKKGALSIGGYGESIKRKGPEVLVRGTIFLNFALMVPFFQEKYARLILNKQVYYKD